LSAGSLRRPTRCRSAASIVAFAAISRPFLQERDDRLPFQPVRYASETNVTHASNLDANRPEFKCIRETSRALRRRSVGNESIRMGYLANQTGEQLKDGPRFQFGLPRADNANYL
jgi:hypothetical protein